MKAVLPRRISPRLFITILIAGLLAETWFVSQRGPDWQSVLLGEAEVTAGEPAGNPPQHAVSVPEKLADKNRPIAPGTKPSTSPVSTPSTNAKLPPPSDLPRPALPRHYPHIRIAMLAYAGNPMGAIEDKLLGESVDLVVSNARYLDHIHSIAPNTPQLVYINTSNLYLDLLADWLQYADANGINPEAAFFHSAQAKPFRGDSPSSRPVTWFWGVYRNGPTIVNLSAVAHSNSGSIRFGGMGESLYVGHIDRFREINLQLASGAKDGWVSALEYSTSPPRPAPRIGEGGRGERSAKPSRGAG